MKQGKNASKKRFKTPVGEPPCAPPSLYISSPLETPPAKRALPLDKKAYVEEVRQFERMLRAAKKGFGWERGLVR